ncbi:hypothetical protein [Serratia microhaemolytica]|uniref:hypothetical protein n=1 Tax=Serratia microhaemolytica TaxID=2675110 RepID=UPI000FDE60A9|nr:hypothetical protein [Serratia microhaemolytica]
MALALKHAILQTAQWQERKQDKITFANEYYRPGYITVLAAYVNHHGIRQEDCSLPNNDYMSAINLFGAIWGEDNYTKKRLNVGENYSLVTPLINVESVDDATSTINSCIRKLVLEGKTASVQGVDELTKVIGELHDNVWSHGKSTGFSFAQRSAVPNTKHEEYYIEFSLADCGCGFLGELKRAGIPSIETHQEAIEWCIQENNSSKHADRQDDWAQRLPLGHIGGNTFGKGVAIKEKDNNHQGLGLYHLMQLVKKYSGELQLATGNVCLEAQGDKVSYEALDSEWKGVAISCRFKINELIVEVDKDTNEENDSQLNEFMRALGGGYEKDSV